MNRDELNRHHDTIVRIVHKVLSRRTNDTSVIDDIAQNVLVICWKYEADGDVLLPHRLERFVVRVALNQYRSWKRKRQMLNWPDGYEVESTKDDPARNAEKTEESMILLSLVNGLPLRYREITRLHIVEGWTHERIAREKDCRADTVRTQFHRAKALLEEEVRRHFLN